MTAKPATTPAMCPYCDEYAMPQEWLDLQTARAKLTEDRRRLVEALRYIVRGYSGTVGNAEGHSGTHCSEYARALLREMGEA